MIKDDGDDKEKDGPKGGLIEKLLKSRTVLISDAVTDKMAREVTAQLIVLQDDDANEPITVYVNSPGGSADSGFAIYDVMKFVKPPIRTICTGLCASAAVLIFLGAKKENRYSLQNSRFLLHQPSTTIMGTASDIEIETGELLRTKDRYFSVIAAETGKMIDQIAKDSDRNFWLSAGQAMEYQLVGKVIKSYSEIK